MDLEVYCDESRPELAARGHVARSEEKVLIGGVWLESRSRRIIKRAIREHRERHRVGGEFKWNRVSPSRLTFYRELVDLFFSSSARFRCLVLPADVLDALHHGGDHELMFYKFYYQLLHHWIYPGNSYRVFIDAKTNRARYRVRELAQVLQSANPSSLVRSVQAVPSHDVEVLQLADVLTGAVGFSFMGGASPAKQAVVRQIEQHIGRKIAPTYRDESKFNVFAWRPGEFW